MKACDELLDRIESGGLDGLDAELERHAAGCERCRGAVERAQGLAEAGRVLASVEAPPSLVTRLKQMPRLAPACETVQDLLAEALESELAAEARAELVAHLQSCASCRAVWEAFATLREVGRLAAPAPRLRAALAISPRNRVDLRHRRRFFDLRLATAAAYLLAALTIMLAGNPASLARASSEGVEKASLYARAAVENRFASLSRRAQEVVTNAEGFVRDTAIHAWEQARRMFRPGSANQATAETVKKGGNGGSS